VAQLPVALRVGAKRENSMSSQSFEEFKPLPIRRDDDFVSQLMFQLRAGIDLQLLTCVRYLRPRLQAMHGAVLDVGCGEKPYRGFLPADASYTGLEIVGAEAFGMRRDPSLLNFDGVHIPFPDNSFDHILCTEVLEHAEDPFELIAQMRRVLKSGGSIVVTVPFAARVHHAPHDYFRFTRFRLQTMFSAFETVEIEERGDDIATVANKLIVICVRLLRPSPALLWRIPIFCMLGPATLIALLVAHLLLWRGYGSKADPLGYGVSAHKR
jgi:SAM-dependent methyltransferase